MFDPTRRQLLALTGSAGLLAGGGVVFAQEFRCEEIDEASLHTEPEPGTGPAATFSRVSDERVEYLEDSDEIRFPVLSGGSEWATRPVAEYATWEMDRLLTRQLRNLVDERIEKPVESVHTGFDTVDGVQTAVVELVYHHRDHCLTKRPNVALDEVISVAPSSVALTIEIDDYTHETTLPVIVREKLQIMANAH